MTFYNKLVFLLPILSVFVLSACGSNEAGYQDETGKYMIKPADANIVMAAVKAEKGNVVLLNLWATWCEPCVEEFPDLVYLHNKYKDDGLRIITVSFDLNETIEDKVLPFLKEYKAGFANYYQDEKIGEQEFLDGIDPEISGVLPSTLIYDTDGNKINMIQSKIDTKELEIEIRGLLKISN